MFIPPMLLQYSKNNQPFDSFKHITELKLDGIRLIVSNLDGSIKLYTRHDNDVTSKFPELTLDAPIPHGTVLDGEIIVTDSEGKPDFENMMSRFQSPRKKTPVTFVAFDILRHRGIDVTSLPLMRRKEILETALTETEHYKVIQVAKGSSTEYFRIVKQLGLEGVVIKEKNSSYEVNRRSWSWQKVINWIETDVYITGFRKKDFGWLTAHKTADGHLQPTGIIELGVSPIHKKAFNGVRKQLIYKEDKHFFYMQPSIQAKVKTRNYTKKGLLRSPVFIDFVL
ncbi:DNA ligase [Paenibacillus sp. 1P03SA]|uniref:ATP-dependent DNA ligase n=1 Tax=Paenibacillus sp. 1P03SA TaxID=3132294 RepID=UPI00399FBAD2